jgi:hypothetical protein
MWILKEIGIDSRKRRLISKLNLDQRDKVQQDVEETRKCGEWRRTLHVAYLCITEYYYTYVKDQQMNTNKYIYHILLFTKKFWSLLQPSAGCHIRIQTAAQNI